MIGQKNIIQRFDKLIADNKLPRFTILCGLRGSGKKTLAKLVSKKMDITMSLVENVKADNIRDVIQSAYKVSEPTLFVIANGDSMSVTAKNALLKLVEEPPNSVYIMLLLENVENTLETIKSRGMVFNMDRYTKDELDLYQETKYGLANKSTLAFCPTPYYIDLIISYGVSKFMDFVNLVVDNVAEVSGSNAFKIGTNIKFKDEEDKYDLDLFWRAFNYVCMSRFIQDNDVKFMRAIAVTNKLLSKLRITGVNKSHLFDMWLLDVRKEWL